jgi:hypothetical protein
MLSNTDKISLINLKLEFWNARLQESINAIETLNGLGNQFKIDGNASDIDNYGKIIQVLETEKEALTNQG